MATDSDTFRENAENCLHFADIAANEPESKRYRRMAEAWSALATEQDWLDGHPAQTQVERARSLAGGTIELSDEDTSDGDAENRKRALIDGPAEFRDDRIDNE